MKISKNKFKIFLYILLISPFLELLTFEQLVEKNSNVRLWNAVMAVYSLLRIAFTFVGVINYSKKGLCRNTLITVSLFVIAENIASFLNGSLYINYTVGSLTIIGFVLICDMMMRRSMQYYLKACRCFFCFLSLANFLTVIIWPNGFFNAPIKDFAIYFLGSKNTAFFYYILFLYFVVLKDIQEHKKPRKRNVIWMIMVIISSYLSSSASALVLFTALFLAYVIWCNFDRLVRNFSFKFVIPVIIIIAAFILVAPLRELLTPLFNLIGRDATFTGRDLLWIQAINSFKNQPIFGSGIKDSFVLKTGVVATHAHSYFLDLLAKFGILGFLAFLLMPSIGVRYIVESRNKEMRVLNILIIALILIHSILDHLMIYNFVLLLATAEGITRYNRHRGSGVIR